MSSTAPNLVDVVLQRVANRTGRRVRELAVEVAAGRVVLRGRADSYHVKQLATHAAREALPTAPLDNAITVG
jgi:osmotically-inducible protein OsmY